MNQYMYILLFVCIITSSHSERITNTNTYTNTSLLGGGGEINNGMKTATKILCVMLYLSIVLVCIFLIRYISAYRTHQRRRVVIKRPLWYHQLMPFEQGQGRGHQDVVNKGYSPRQNWLFTKNPTQKRRSNAD